MVLRIKHQFKTLYINTILNKAHKKTVLINIVF